MFFSKKNKTLRIADDDGWNIDDYWRYNILLRSFLTETARQESYDILFFFFYLREENFSWWRMAISWKWMKRKILFFYIRSINKESPWLEEFFYASIIIHGNGGNNFFFRGTAVCGKKVEKKSRIHSPKKEKIKWRREALTNCVLS